MKNKLESLIIESGDIIEQYNIMKKKLSNLSKENKERKINNKRLKIK